MIVLEYKLKKDKSSTLGISAMSIVDEPAILNDFIKLSKEEVEIKMSIDNDQQIISGPALIPDLKIFRSAKSLGLEEDGYMFFSKDTIKEMAELFMTNENMNNITLGHDTVNTDLRLIESWLVMNSENDKASELGFNVPNGTWMISYKVESTELWNRIKEGEFNGFSIEASGFDKIEQDVEMEADLTEDEVADIVYEKLAEELKNKYAKD